MFKIKIDKKAIEELISLLKKNNLSQIEIKNGNKSIKIAKESIQVQKISSSGTESQVNTIKNDDFSKEKTNIQPISNANTVKAPMLGTLYHAPSPKSQPFIKEGKKVKEGDILFIIEAMKTMNQVKSDRTGVVKKILVENGLPVEFNQDLVIIE